MRFQNKAKERNEEMRSQYNNEVASWDEFAAQLTDAAYQAALQHGLRGSFLEVELSIWKAVRSVVQPDDTRRTNWSNGTAANKHLAASAKDRHAGRLCLAGT
jgi:hypothetical protein